MRMGVIFQDATCILNHRPLYGAVSPVKRIHGPRNYGVEAGETYYYHSHWGLVEFGLPNITTLVSAGLEVFFPKGEIFHKRTQQESY